MARSIVSGFLLPLDPDVEELADLRCAVSEAVTNCIVHAYKKGTGKITLILKSFEDRTFKMTIIDKGCGIPEDRCGMGFSIMESFSDKLDIKSAVGKGTRITLTKKLSSPENT